MRDISCTVPWFCSSLPVQRLSSSGLLIGAGNTAGGKSINREFRNGAGATAVMVEAEVLKKVHLKGHRTKCGVRGDRDKEVIKGLKIRMEGLGHWVQRAAKLQGPWEQWPWLLRIQIAYVYYDSCDTSNHCLLLLAALCYLLPQPITAGNWELQELPSATVTSD